jgi:hypothetical protein
MVFKGGEVVKRIVGLRGEDEFKQVLDESL